MQNASAIAQIIQPGLLATLQDRGRFGHLAEGITTGGPVDEYSFLWGNKLLSNRAGAAQIEITLGGFQATILNSSQMVVCGAPMQVELNGNRIPNWLVFDVGKGDVLTIAPGASGLRSYLAVRGGFVARAVYGSVATVTRDKLGGLNGRGAALGVDDVLTAPRDSLPPLLPRRPRTDYVPDYNSESLTIDVIPAGQYSQFSRPSIDQFFAQPYTVTAAQDRMGMRLKASHRIDWSHTQILSEPLPIGAIQIPPDGQPIIMLVDRQTLGGYPKIGTVSWRSRCLLGQASAGTQLRLREQSVAAAQIEWRQFQRFFSG
ncbi:MAG TPA: biotin-dependent carboxyltransferase family protein [Pseudidiomarina sp.]|nr:biotin-dependent carboxyltransferase family protein [Pseudidiomarina sp.]